MPATLQRAPTAQPPRAPGRDRFALLDALRGLALVGMILYHLCFNLDSIFQLPLPWFHTPGAAVWQFVNSGLFLLLAGVCARFTRRVFRRAARLMAVALGLSLVTLLFMPSELIVFGILHCIALCLFLYGLARRPLERVPAGAGCCACVLLFLLTFGLPRGHLLFGPLAIPLPAEFYAFYPLSFLGFQSASFYSADYFPLLPYFFLFLLGYYLGSFFLRLPPRVQGAGFRPLNFLGRHSLIVYLLHQPLLLGAMLLLLGGIPS